MSVAAMVVEGVLSIVVVCGVVDVVACGAVDDAGAVAAAVEPSARPPSPCFFSIAALELDRELESGLSRN